MKAVKITNSVFEVGPGGYSEEKFKGGSVHALGADTQRQVDLRNAEIIDVPDDADAAAEEAAAAQAIADEAAAAAQAAQEAADAAAALADADSVGAPKIETPAEIVAEVVADQKPAAKATKK